MRGFETEWQAFRRAVVVAAAAWVVLAGAVVIPAARAQGAASGELTDAPWRKSEGPFRAEILFTKDSEALFKSWNRSSVPERRPDLVELTSLPRGGSIDVAVLVGGCQPALTGLCDCEADFVVAAPDGSTYARHEGADVWRRKKAPVEGVLKVGVASLELQIEPEDTLGTYRIEVTVRDNVASRELRLVRELEVVGP